MYTNFRWSHSKSARVLAFSVLALIPLINQNPKCVYGAPTNSDTNDTTFPLELQPPLIDDDVTDFNGKKSSPLRTSSLPIDNYGVPIALLKPIETPDGRKIISAQGLQFEIPNYASGITEIKKPSDDLLPPFIDPIAVADDSSISSGPVTNATDTIVEIENAHIIELTTSPELQRAHEESVFPGIVKQALQAAAPSSALSVLPDYLLDLNDPDIAGPIAYQPDTNVAHKVLAWDLLPPSENQETQIVTFENSEPKVDGNGNDVTENKDITTPVVNNKVLEPLTGGQVSEVNLLTGDHKTTVDFIGNETDTKANDTSNSFGTGAVPTSIPYVQPGTYQSTTTTTTNNHIHIRTTAKPIIQQSYTTNGPTTKPWLNRESSKATTNAPATTTTTTAYRIESTSTDDSLDPNTFYKLEKGDSYTLPPWLEDFDDPDLDAAVLYDIPDDIKEYNHSIPRDILPPLEPFVDLQNIHFSAPINEKPNFDVTTRRIITTSTTTPATTKKPLTTTTTPPRTISTTTQYSTPSTTRAHWIRAYPTTRNSKDNATTPTSTSTNRKQILSAFSFSSHPSTSNQNALNEFSNKHSGTKTLTPSHQQQQQQQHHQRQHQNPLQYQTHLNQRIQTLTPNSMHKPFSTANTTLPITSTDDSKLNIPASATSSSSPGITEKSRNPFLPRPFSGIRTKTTTARPAIKLTVTTASKTTAAPPSPTATTTTTVAPPLEENPFDSATIPAWLSDFDYPDVGSGVPFVYNPEDPENTVYNNLLPPTDTQESDTTDNIQTAGSSPVSFQQSLNPSQATAHPSNTITTSLSKNNANENSDNNSGNNRGNNKADDNDSDGKILNYDDNNDDVSNQNNPNFETLTELPTIISESPSITNADQNDFTTINNPHQLHLHHNHQPSVDHSAKDTSINFNQNFPEDRKNNDREGENQQHHSLTPESGGNGDAGGNAPIKTTFAKSGEGKVIRTNIFLSPGSAANSPTAKPLQNIGPTKDASNPINNNLDSSATRPPKIGSTASTNNGAHYTGSFGGAPGVLGNGKIGYAVQPDGSIRDPDHTYRPPSATVTTRSSGRSPIAIAETAPQPAFVGFVNRVREPSASASNENRYHGTFGGPPGILVPYDNTKTIKT